MRINSEADIQALGKVSGSVKKQLLNALNTPDYSRQTNKSSERLKREARKDFVLLPEYDRDPDPENVLVRESIKRWGHAYYGGIVIPELSIPPRKFRMDVALVSHKICIEFDGWSHHSKKDATRNDHEKMEYLATHGWLTLKIGMKRLKHDLNGFFESVDKIMDTRPVGDFHASYNAGTRKKASFCSTLSFWKQKKSTCVKVTEFIHRDLSTGCE